MITREDILSSMVEEERKMYEPMFKQINVAEFVKAITYYAGFNSVQSVSNDSIMCYLITWARNKYKYFQKLGNKVRLDIPIEYEDVEDNTREKIRELERQFPGYAPWLEGFDTLSQNKITSEYEIDYETRSRLHRLLSLDVAGMTMTHIFKRYLQAPEELVTAIGRLFEHQKVSATHTISIDPVDMMLASENPYGWTSCYRLNPENDSSHADGCLAAVLDSSSLITYVWNNEGKFMLGNDKDFTFKSIRYKRMRRWISIAPNFDAIHFNMIYPGKNSYPETFDKLLREGVENIVAENGVWGRVGDRYCSNIGCWRENYYGYGEYDDSRIYILKEVNGEKLDPSRNLRWSVYDEVAVCPCGCRNDMPCSDDCEDNNLRYNGYGFTYENFDEEYYCEYCDEYCTHECCREYCEGCCVWRDNHPICELDGETECENIDWDNVSGGTISCDQHSCEGCPLYALHHPSEEDEDTYEDRVINENL